jgi:hypothetical protein
MDPRKAHVGKSAPEQQQYHAFLKQGQAEYPTLESAEEDSTNTPQIDDSGSPQKGGNDRKDYTPRKQRIFDTENIINITVGIILFVFTGIIGLVAISLNREVGVVIERQNNETKRLDEATELLRDLDRDLLELRLRVQIRQDEESSEP